MPSQSMPLFRMCCVASGLVTAMAQDLKKADVEGVHGKIDGNKDGKVSLEELVAFAHQYKREQASKDIHFFLDEVDTNKDGMMSFEELMRDMAQEEGDPVARRHQELEKAKFEAADGNKDGLLDKAELPGLLFPETHEEVHGIMTEASLRHQDEDLDGKLSKEEFAKGLDEHAEDFEEADKDGDRLLDAAELAAWNTGAHHLEKTMREMIARGDKDGDGHMTAEELHAVQRDLKDGDALGHLQDWVGEHLGGEEL